MVQNFHQEHDAPPPPPPCKDPVHCVFISLVIWLEFYLTQQQQQELSPYGFDFSSDFAVPGSGDKTNDFLRNTLWD